VVVTGRVQGVFFRDTCRRRALAHGVAGWVRNRPDGTVEAVFEGTDEAVGRLLAWAREGQPGAVVDDTTVTAEPPRGETGFTIA